MPGGLFILVAYGAQDIALTGNPTENFFKYHSVTHTHFAKEPVILTPTKSVDTPDKNKTTELRFQLKRVGDFIHGANLLLTIPSLAVSDESPYEIRWAKYPGLAIIDEMRAIVGGTEVQTLDRDTMFSIMKMDMEDEQRVIYEDMVGNVNELVDPANGSYTPLLGGYPYIGLSDTFSLPERQLCIPTLFWFTRAIQEALPIGFLTLHEAEIVIKLAPWSRLIQVRPRNSVPSVQWTSPPSDFNIKDYIVSYSGNWELNPRLECIYYFLSDDERMSMARQEIKVPVFRMRKYIEHTERPGVRSYYTDPSGNFIYTNNLTKTDNTTITLKQEGNPIRRLCTIARRRDYLENNDWTRLGNWQFGDIGRDLSTGDIYAYKDNIIESFTFKMNGNVILDEMKSCYMNRYDQYEFSRGRGYDGLWSYSFGIKNEECRSKGTLNLGRVRDPEINIRVTPTNVSPSVYSVLVMVECINWFVYTSGHAGLVYAT